MSPQTCPHCSAAPPETNVAAGAATVEFLCPACGGSLQPNHDGATVTLIAPRALGKFQLLDKIGAGAFGEVWRARDTELHRIVAVKIPHPSSLAAKGNLERFYREARAAAQLRHPGIVTVYEVSLHDDVPVIVSDFIEGVTLRELLEVRKLSFREAAVLVAQVVDALDYAHAMGLVHRDVKPANIMIEFPRGVSLSTPPDEFLKRMRPGGRDSFDTLTLSASSSDAHASQSTTVGPRALILDFWLARRDDVEATLTVEGQVLGTPAYMSPEQAAGQGHKVDRRSDIYALGAVLYELICGRPPFQGSPAMIVHQVLRDEPPPRKLNDKTPRDLQTICLKAIAKAVGGRYATARELADDLRCFLIGEPIRARAVSLPERVWRWSRRNPVTASLMATVLVLLVIVAVTSSAFAIRLE